MDLTNVEAVVYNEIITDFNINERSKVRPYGPLRFGQAFYNYGYQLGIFKGSYPELFYCEDNEEAKIMIETCLCEYVKENV